MSGSARRISAAASASAGLFRAPAPALFASSSSSRAALPLSFGTAKATPPARRSSGSSQLAPRRLFSSSSPSSSSAQKKASRKHEKRPLPFSTVSSCPSPTCTCEPTPELPENLPIDYKSPLNGLIGAYDEQVLICTGTSDWPSRIEDANSGDNLAADLKELFGRGGTYSDPYHHVSVLNASFPASVPHNTDLQSSSVYLLPSFTYVPFLPRLSFDAVEALAQGFLLPERLHSAHDGLLSPIHRDRLTRRPAVRNLLYGVRESIPDVLVLICGHGGRDARCGIMGPVLQAAFERELARVGFQVEQGPVEIDGEDSVASAKTSARVGLISHIGGHKFAGNVIVYLPPSLRTPDGVAAHPLAGYGVWYGRVEPQHVEGLVQETVLQGRVVEDHFRGAINQKRQIIRM
ncbi:Altered inheritance of mitochondria protein 32 [Sporothrix bragantina]|uniref:Altered inheritance of mitochondria protein 32 n=1 Tax=Sporothrix bragantina TaxID=671064 RepID=A0ABP0B9N5_9PEZI